MFTMDPKMVAYVIVLMYAAEIAPRLHPQVSEVLKNNIWIKMALISFIFAIALHNFELGVLLGIALVVTVNLTSGRGALEPFSYGPYPFDTDMQPNPQSLLEMRTDTFPQCANLTMADIYEAFKIENIEKQPLSFSIKELMKNDKTVDPQERFKKFMTYMVEPRESYYTSITDADAPRIASFLVENGFDFGQKCGGFTQNPGVSAT